MFPHLLLLTLTSQQLFLRGLPIKVQAAPCDEPQYCFSPQGPATLCLGEGPAQTCYTAPGDHGRDPGAEIVQIDKKTQAILFQASGSGASAYPIHFALLRQTPSGKLENILPSAFKLSSQSQHRFFNDPSLYATPIFVTADYHWGLNDSHHGAHRFFISVYLLQKHLDSGTTKYTLADRFMTRKRYGVVDSDDDILTAEAPEWKSRLRRVLESTR
ncbi:hypothetical protein WDZ92_22715 [Nostoc sp. NIES-2111]